MRESSKFFNPLAIIPIVLISLLFTIPLVVHTKVNAQNTQLFDEYPLTVGSIPTDIAEGPDGNLWFTQAGNNKIGKITQEGVITEFNIPGGAASGITGGLDGNVWFTINSNPNRIGKITPEGTITTFDLPFRNNHLGYNYNRSQEITTDIDGNLWFTQYIGDWIGRITPNGVITEFPTPHDTTSVSFPWGITTGSDGNIWFTEYYGDKIGKITPSGEITKYALPAAGSRPQGITAGPDGNLWFVESNANKVGRITPSGIITEFLIPTDNSLPWDITKGLDGNLWFTERAVFKIGRITPDGVITEYPLASFNLLAGITTDSIGNIWFAIRDQHKIGRLNISNLPVPSATPTSTPNPSPGGPCVMPNFGDERGNPFRQEDDQWKNLPYGGNYYRKSDGTRVFLPFKYYGNNKDTIGAWGCKTTSAAMIVNYYAKQQNVIDPSNGNIFQTDPKILNEWLQQNDGYYSGHALPVGNPTYWDTAFLDLKAVVKYARNNGVNISNNGTLRRSTGESDAQFISKTKDRVNNSMCALNPAIFGVNNSGHFIDATGKAVDSGIDTWQIHDPLWNGNPPGISTLKAKYNNAYNQVDLMSGNLPKKHLTLVKYSPVEMYVTDPEGKKIGLDVFTDTFYEEIPDASYGTEFLGAADGGGGLIEAGVLDIVDPIEGDYTLTVIGTGDGEYGLEVRESNEEADFTSNKIFNTTATDRVNTYLITPSVDSEGQAIIQDKIEVRVIPDKVNPNRGVVGVVLMGNADFNVKDIKIPSVTLGEGGAKPLLNRGFTVDMNKDSEKDLLLFFRANQTGISQEDSELCLTGSRKNGLLFKGCDDVMITQQVQPFLSMLLNILRSVEPRELLKIRQFLDSTDRN